MSNTGGRLRLAYAGRMPAVCIAAILAALSGPLIEDSKRGLITKQPDDTASAARSRSGEARTTTTNGMILLARP